MNVVSSRIIHFHAVCMHRFLQCAVRKNNDDNNNSKKYQTKRNEKRERKRPENTDSTPFNKM